MAIDIEHRDAPVGEIHGLVNWFVPNQPALGDIVPTSADLYKSALVVVPGGFDFLVLTSVTPVTWTSISAPQDLSEYIAIATTSGTSKTLADWARDIELATAGTANKMIAVPSVAAAQNLTGLTSSTFVFVANDGSTDGEGSTIYKLGTGTDPHNPPQLILTSSNQRLVPTGVPYEVRQFATDAAQGVLDTFLDSPDPLPIYQLRDALIDERAADFSLVESLAGSSFVCTAAVTCTVPDDATLALAVGFTVEFFAEAGISSVAAENGNVTIIAKNNDLTIQQGVWRAITKIRANTWSLI